VQHVLGEPVGERAWFRRRDVLVDEIGERQLAAVRAEAGDVEVPRRHQLGDDVVDLGEERRQVAAGEHELRDAESRRLHLLAAAALRDVHAHGEQALLAPELDRVGVDDQRRDAAALVAQMRLGVAHHPVAAELLEHLVALPEVHPDAEVERAAPDGLVAREARGAGEGRVDLDDRAVAGAADHHDGGVELEALLEIRAHLALRRLDLLVVDRCGGLRRDEHQQPLVLLGVGGGIVVILRRDHANRAALDDQRGAKPLRGRVARGDVLAALADDRDDLLGGGPQRLAAVDDVFGQAVARRPGRRMRRGLVDEVGEREDRTLVVEQRDVEISRGHQVGDDAVELRQQRRQVVAAEHRLRNGVDRGLDLVAPDALGDVDADGEHARLAAELDDVGVQQERAHRAGLGAKIGLEVADDPVGADAAQEFVALPGVGPQAEFERGLTDDLVVRVAAGPGEGGVDLDDFSVARARDAHQRGIGVEALLEIRLRLALAGGAGGERGAGARQLVGALGHAPFEVAVRRQQRLLVLLPLGDVADMRGEDGRAVDLEPRDRELDGKLRAVGAHRRDLDPVPEHVRRAAVGEAGEPGAVTLAQRGRDDQLRHLAAEDVGPRAAEGAFGGGVEIDESPLVIDRDDAVERDVQDPREVGLKTRLRGGEGGAGRHAGLEELRQKRRAPRSAIMRWAAKSRSARKKGPRVTGPRTSSAWRRGRTRRSRSRRPSC
jgi:hypothetical protein